MKTEYSTKLTWDRVALATCVGIMLAAVVVIVGWHAHIRVAVQIFPGLIPMQYNTALCFLAMGAAGIGLSTRRRLLLLIGGSFVVLMGSAVILEYATGRSFGIDPLFFYPWEPSLSVDPGRMALTTAISFFLAGCALLILGVRQRSYSIFGIFNSIPLSLALTSLIGYAFRITYLLPFNLGSQMPLHTSLAFLIYGIATMGYAWKYAERGSDGLPKWGAGIGVALLPMLLVGASALFPEQSWSVLPYEIVVSLLCVVLITLVVQRLNYAKVAYKGLLMIAFPLIVLLTFVGLGVNVREANQSAQRRALRLRETIGIAQSLLKHIAEAESGVRGYVITGDETFVASFNESNALVANLTAQLSESEVNSPLQVARARKIARLAGERMDYLSKIVDTVRAGDKDQAEGIIKGKKGAELMGKVVAEVSAFSDEENRVIGDDRKITDASWQRLSWLLIASTSAAILVTTILSLMFSGGISKRLMQLRNNAISFAAGKKLEAPLTGDDEIAELDRVFHEMAESLDEATRREKAVIEGSTDGIFIKDVDQRFLMINQVGADLIGKTAGEIVGTTVYEHFTVETTKQIVALDLKVLSTGKSETTELQATTRGGSHGTFLSTRAPYRDRHGTVVGVIGINRDITGRKQAEEALQASETRFQNAFDHAPIGITLVSPVGRFLQVNESFCVMVGYSKDELLQMDYQSLTQADDLPRSQEMVRRLLTGEFSTLKVEKRYLHKLGHEVFALTHLSLVHDAESNPLYIIAQTLDISERKQAEIELTKNETRLTEAQHIANLGSWEWDVLTNDVRWSNELYRIFGLEPTEASATFGRFLAYIHPDDRKLAETIIGQALKDKVFSECDYRIIRPDGKIRALHSKGEVIVDETGNVISLWGTLQDITARKQIDEQLRESEEKYRTILERIEDGYFEVDLKGVYSFVNDSFCRISGHTASELLGVSYRKFFSPELSQLLFDTYHSVYETGEPIMGFEYEITRNDGVTRFVEESINLKQDTEGQPIGFMGIRRDCTDRKRGENEREVISEVIQSVNVTSNLDELLKKVHESLKKVLYAENCCVALYDKQTGLFVAPLFIDLVETNPFPVALSKNCTAKVFNSGQPLLMNEAIFNELLEDGEVELIGRPAPSFLAVPLMTPVETLGVIVLQHYELENAYNSRDVEFLSAVAAQLALAIERKRTEEALIESDRRFRDLFYDAPVGYHELDTEGRITDVNTTELSMLGYSSEEMIGHHVWDFIEEADVARSTFAEKLSGRKPLRNVERSFRRKDGTYMAVQLDDQMLKDPNGRFIGIRATMQDIGERKQSERALKDSEERYRELFENASDLVCTMDLQGNYSSLNKSGERLTGYKESEAITFNMAKIVTPETMGVVREMMSRKLDEDITTTYEIDIIRKDRKVITIEISSRLLHQGGKAIGIQAIGRDITQRKQVEAELKRARDAALESVRLKSEFLANMSHEIRTPMNGVIGMTGLLLDTELNAEQRDFTETINTSADALLTIIDDILDFSKIESGLLRFEKIDFELRSAVESPVELLAERAQAKGLELASIVYRDVPTALRGDPGRLRQVLTNLIGNAVKFTEHGEVVVSVTTVLATASHVTLRFEIQDTGIGISAESQPGLFHAFTQADGSTTRKYGGTGLGLAISKQLVELMGGEIGIDSTPGVGSIFWFTASFEKQITLESLELEPASNLIGTRILVVDDNATNRRILKHQTSSWGMIVTEAESGSHALELLRAGISRGEAYDIALLDLMMPDMNGFELAEAIKSDPTIAGVDLVLLPSFGKPGHGVKALHAGIAAYLQKPVRQSQLHDCLVTVMAHSNGEPVAVTRLVTKHSMHESEVQRKVRKLSSTRILIAEDNLVNQKVALGQLYNLGYRAEAVSNGRELLEALEENPVDIILMDCQMPEMDGFAATEEIRRREGTSRHTTIIAMTANALEGDYQSCLAAGMDDYLSKPVKAEVMRRKLERWIKPNEAGTVLGNGSDSPNGSKSGVIDRTQFESLRVIQQPGEADFVTELIDLFLNEATSTLKNLHEAVTIDDSVQIQRLAHRLRGSSANMGATRMVSLSGDLEKKNSSKTVKEKLIQLEVEFGLVREALTADRRET